VPLAERDLLRSPRKIHETAGLMLQTPSKIPLSIIDHKGKNCRYLPQNLVEKKKGCVKTIYQELRKINAEISLQKGEFGRMAGRPRRLESGKEIC
jgi:hypothetical protein